MRARVNELYGWVHHLFLRHSGEPLEGQAAAMDDSGTSDEPASEGPSADEAPSDDDNPAWVRHVEAAIDLAAEMEEAVAERVFENPARAQAALHTLHV